MGKCRSYRLRLIMLAIFFSFLNNNNFHTSVTFLHKIVKIRNLRTSDRFPASVSISGSTGGILKRQHRFSVGIKSITSITNDHLHMVYSFVSSVVVSCAEQAFNIIPFEISLRHLRHISNISRIVTFDVICSNLRLLYH